jgi:DNA-binding beta-propeller fold protein YncE
VRANSRLRHVVDAVVVALIALVSAAPTTGTAEIAAGTRLTPPPARTLYVTNGVTANIAALAIGRDGRPSPIDALVPTDAVPRGIVFSPDGARAYVVNTGANDITVYAVATDGKLTRLGAPAATGAFPFGIAMSPDGKAVYTSNSDDDSVSAFAVNGDGTLTRLGDAAPAVDDFPRGVAVSPDGRFLYTANGRSGDTEPDSVTMFAIRPDRTLVRRGSIPMGASGIGIVFTPDARFLYVNCEYSANVYGFRVGADGDLTPVPRSPFAAAGFPLGINVTPSGRHLYVASGGSPVDPAETVLTHGFAIGGDGALTPVPGSPFTAGNGPVGITPTPDGRHLYVSNFGSSDISAFGIDGSGALREIDGSPFPTGGARPLYQSAAVRPNQGPIASFSATARAAGRPARFDASAAADPDGAVARYDWDFGDGTVRPNGGAMPAHVYRRSGTFRVTLVVTDHEGCSARRVFTGQTAWCNGSGAARTTRTVVVR